MNKSTVGITKIIITFFAILAAILASLWIFGAINQDTLTDSLSRIGGVSVVAIITAFIISLVTGLGKDK